MAKKSILSVLSAHRFGLTVREIVTVTDQTPAAIRAELLRLEAEGHASQRVVGRVVVWTASALAVTQSPQRVDSAAKTSRKKAQGTAKPSPAKAECLAPITGHLQLDLKEGAVRVPFSDVNTLRDFVNDLATRRPK